MAILEGGIFSNPRGKTGGIVFGAARTRTGKKVTSRLLVPPSNPNTAAQQVQRGKFSEALAIVRLIGSSFYQGDWNRAIGQLPGFQSMTSVFLNSLDAVEEIGTIPPINLGSLHKSDVFTSAAGGSGAVNIEWGAELGINGTTADIYVLFGIATDPATNPLERVVVVDTSATRADNAKTLSGFIANTDVTTIGYFRGVGAAEGLLSATNFVQGLSGA